LLQKLWVTETVDRRSSNGRWRSTRTADNTELVNKLVLHKHGQARYNTCPLYLIIRPYCLQKIIKIGWWMLKIQQAKAVLF